MVADSERAWCEAVKDAAACDEADAEVDDEAEAEVDDEAEAEVDAEVEAEVDDGGTRTADR